MNHSAEKRRLASDQGRAWPKRDITEKIVGRESQELILGLSGAVGAGLSVIKNEFIASLKSVGYTVAEIKISDIIKSKASKLLLTTGDVASSEKYSTLPEAKDLERYEQLQDAGNTLRQKLGNEILAKLAISEIARSSKRQEVEIKNPDSPPARVVYIIDQLKHQAEALLLRRVYGNNFYLVGVLDTEESRVTRIKAETSAPEAEVRRVIDRDRREEEDHGQQLDKTLKYSDFFVRHSSGSKERIKSRIDRFIKLVHGDVAVTPTVEEFGMYVAYSSGLASACMSRQVGAAILAQDGTVLSTGCNDVPKAGGGLYQSGDNDHRCVMNTSGICHNDDEKRKIISSIKEILRESAIENSRVDSIAEKIRKYTRLGDLIEFSRAVHAEMDALISISRRGGVSVKGSTLYSTTYPCHNCARHILASGIKVVIFIEPYEKSLARSLHSDAIVHDYEPTSPPAGKVPFIHFEGVAPRIYQELFIFPNGRKQGGKRLDPDLSLQSKKIPQFLDGYRVIEKKLLEDLVEKNLIDPPIILSE